MTLKPTKHSHPDKTIIFASMVLISRLKKRRIEDYDSLRKFIKETVSGGDFLFLPALNFLFLMGCVEYRPKNDSFEYTGK